MQQVREGKKRGSIISDQSVDSLSTNERLVWRTIRKELEDIGLTISAFEANREFIFDWFLQAVESGSFQLETMASRRERFASGPTSPRSPASPASPASLLILPPPQTPDPLSNRNSRVEASDLPDDVSEDYWALPPLAESELSTGNSEATQVPKPETTASENKNRSSSGMSTLLNSMSLTKKKDSRSSKPTKSPSPTKERKSRKGTKESELKKSESSKQGALSEILSSGAMWRLPDKKMMDVGLFQACKSGSGKALTALIEKGADVNAVNEEGKSALMEAIFWGHEQTVRWLLKHGANVHHRGGSRMTPIPGLLVTATPIGVAVSKRNLPILEVLLAAGADVNAQKYPLSVLQEAALMGKPVIIEMLLNAKAKINNYSTDYGTALMLALRHRKEEAAKLLVEKGARVKHSLDKPTKDGLTSPIEAAIAAEKFSQVNFLVSEIVVVTSTKEARELLKWAQQRYKKKPPAPLSEEQKQIAGLLVDLVQQFEDEER